MGKALKVKRLKRERKGRKTKGEGDGSPATGATCSTTPTNSTASSPVQEKACESLQVVHSCRRPATCTFRSIEPPGALARAPSPWSTLLEEERRCRRCSSCSTRGRRTGAGRRSAARQTTPTEAERWEGRGVRWRRWSRELSSNDGCGSAASEAPKRQRRWRLFEEAVNKTRKAGRRIKNLVETYRPASRQPACRPSSLRSGSCRAKPAASSCGRS